MRTHTRKFLLAALVSLAALLAGACDDDGASNEPGDTATLDATSDTTGGDDTSQADTSGDDTAGDDTAGTDTAEDTADAADMQVECGEPTGMRPPRLSEHAGVFDEAGNQLVIHGGSLGIPENCGFPTPTFERTTWLYDVACDQWRQLEADNAPARARHAAVYDSAGRRMIVFGGRFRDATSGPYTLFNDVWALDLESETWSQLTTSGTAPVARVNHTMAYDPGNHRVLVFGGSSQTGLNIAPLADVWALDLESGAWSDVTPQSAGPDPRLWVSGLWDAKNNWFVVFGGGDDGAFTTQVDYFEDVWAFTDANGTPSWLQLDLGGGAVPQGRFWAGFGYDPAGERYVLFGGHDDTNLGNRNDVWFFDPFAGTWSSHLEGDVFNNPPTGVCEFPPDFTVIDPESPERRNAHVFVTGDGGAFAMGGKTDCGVIDDLTRFDLAAGTWQTLTRATQGEVCLRRGGGDSCTDLCL